MPQVTVTKSDGEQVEVSCPGVPPADIDAAYIEQRTSYDVDSVEVVPDAEDRIGQLEKAVGASNGGGSRGIAQRIDELEDRIAELESHH